MEPEVALGRLRAAVADIRGVLATGDLDAPVPRCPGWTLHDLGAHLCGVHRWVMTAFGVGDPRAEPPPAPAGRGPLLDWYDEGAAALIDLLAATDPATPCWTFGPKPPTAAFWFRRQVHEHAIHAQDAVAAAGGDRPVEPEVALDGIDEVVRIFFPRQVRLGRAEPLARPLAVRPDEAAGARWLLAGDGSGAAADGTGATGDADAEISGPAGALYLLLWRRIDLDDARLAVTGDQAVAREVLASGITP